MHAFVLAGGFATRLWPLTEKRAKPLLPLTGKPLLTHLVERIPGGIPITISTNAVFAKDFKHWKSEHFSILVYCNPDPLSCNADDKPCAQDEPRAEPEIQILIEDAGHEDEKLGALGAVAKWITENNVNDDVLLLAGDNYVGFSIEEFLNAYRGNPLLAAHDIGDSERAKLFGTVITESGIRNASTGLSTGQESGIQRVTAFEEKPGHPRSTLVSTGVIILPKRMLPMLVEFAGKHPDHIGGIFEHLINRGMTVECVAFDEPWFDIGSFEAYLEATKALVGNNTLRGKHATDKKCAFEGSVVIGNNSTVARSTLRNVVLFDNCTIEDCRLEDCILDNDCALKGVDLTGKMLREGATLVRQK